MYWEIKGLVSETRSSEHINVLIHVQLDGLMVNFTLQPAKLYIDLGTFVAVEVRSIVSPIWTGNGHFSQTSQCDCATPPANQTGFNLRSKTFPTWVSDDIIVGPHVHAERGGAVFQRKHH